METLCETDTFGCKKGVELRAVASCMMDPAVMNDEDSRNDDSP